MPYYTFGEKADRLIQLDLRGDGRIRVYVRAADGAGNMQTNVAQSLAAFTPAADPSLPIGIKLWASPWGKVSVQDEEWNPTYGDDIVYTLGMPDPTQAPPLSTPFGSDLEWGGGTRAANARGINERNMLFDKFGVLTFGAEDGSGCWNFTRNVSNAPSGAGTLPTDRRTAVVLRVSAGNAGRITLSNFGAPGVFNI